MTQIMKLKSSG